MTQVCCPGCRLRFASAAAAYLVVCPECGQPVESALGAADVIGFRLFTPEDVPHELPEAVAVSIPVPNPRGGRP
jgi:predicted amidophosphoribosyltransferase